jgi:hypothetical protein
VRRYTDEEREEAAMLCSITASDAAADEKGGNVAPYLTTTFTAAVWLGSSGRVSELAAGAVEQTMARPVPFAHACAEAASWILSGWSPGDTWTDADRKRAGIKERL